MIMHSKILIINADEQDLSRMTDLLSVSKYRLSSTGNVEQAFEILSEDDFDLAIVGSADESTTLKTISRIRLSFPWIETVVLGNAPESGSLVAAGAYDCLNAACSDELLILGIERALERGRMKRELTTLRQQVAMNYGFDNIVGLSEPTTKLKETISRIAPTDITMLLNGPTGTGKELIANVIHYHSRRRKQRLVTVDCSAIPAGHFEAHLFGDSSTGDNAEGQARPGALLEADGGTLFLNEVDKMPPVAQQQFLEFLKTPSMRRSESESPIKLNIRIIAATSKNLAKLIRDGEFNEDLFGRLNVLPLRVPALTERPEDIQMLTEYFLRRLSQEMDRPSFTISRRAIDLLLGHRWPGNVRELENTLKRATALCKGGHLEADDIIFIEPHKGTAGTSSLRRTILVRRNGRLDETQKSVIQRALEENNWNFSQTAQELGIGRTTLWRKVKKYDLKREETADMVTAE